MVVTNMNTSLVTDKLERRLHTLTVKTGHPPKRLSIGVNLAPVLKNEINYQGPLAYSVTRRGALHFCGVRVRIRDYARERQHKWHGPGAMLP
jgi:hypothetical protein